jgi:DNA-binding NarL/FixJ family response regulator
MPVKQAVVADPNPLWRKASELLLRSNQVEVAATTDWLSEASGLIGSLRPDLVVIEPDQQDREPQEWIRDHRQRYPTMQVIVFSSCRSTAPTSIGWAFLRT